MMPSDRYWRDLNVALAADVEKIVKLLDDQPVPTEGRMTWPPPTLRCLDCGMPYTPGEHHLCRL